jgi:putative ABC transport system permease protein
VSRRLTSVAILRCLGCPADLAFSVYVIQAAALGLAGAILGAMVGVSLHTIILGLFRHSLPVEIEAAPSWLVVARTTAAGFTVCCGFALFPLLRVRAVPPAATLRETVPQLSVRRVWPLWLGLGVLLTLLNLERGAHWLRALSFTGALVLAFLLLAGTARLLTALARRVPHPRWPYLLRQGIANLHRPRNQTLLFLLSLGLGTFLLLTILLAKNLLLDQVNLHRLAESPNIYLVDVQADQVEGVTALVRAQGLPILEKAPLVTMRIQSVRGVPVRDLEKKGEIPKWVLQREFRSTWRDHLTATEKIVAGAWSSATPAPGAPVAISLEKELAKDLRVNVGDEIVMDVQGITIPVRVASLREVDWSRFNLNFFMVFPPGVLEGAPGFQVLTTRVPEGTSSGSLQRALVKQFPNVSAIDLTPLLANVRSILEQVARVVTVLAGFTVLAALPILIGTLWNGRAQRLQESVLLRTLGASARQIRVILVVEYATLGVLSAATGLVLALAANTALAKWVFKGSPWPDPSLVLATFAAATVLALLAGLALSRGVSRHPPLAILRGE